MNVAALYLKALFLSRKHAEEIINLLLPSTPKPRGKNTTGNDPPAKSACEQRNAARAEERIKIKREVLSDSLAAVRWTVFLTLLSVLYLEGSMPGRYVELLETELLQEQFATRYTVENIPATVLDLTNIQKAATVDGRTQMVTSPEALQHLIENLVADKNLLPRAIGVDVDLSAEDGAQFRDAGYATLFDTCLKIEQDDHVPIFLGVSRGARRGQDGWLGPGYAKLAAIANEPRMEDEVQTTHPDNTRLLAWEELPRPNSSGGISLAKPKDVLYGLSFLLGRTAHENSALDGSEEGESDLPGPKPMSDAWLQLPLPGRLILGTLEKTPFIQGSQAASYRIDYGSLEILMEQPLRSVPTDKRDIDARINDKIIIIGDASDPPLSDSFFLAGVGIVPGVYKQACGAVTLAQPHPLSEFKPALRVLIDPLIACVLLALVTWAQMVFANEGRRLKAFALPLLFLVTGIGVVVISLLLADWHVFWAEGLFVALALVAHPLVHGVGELLGELLSGLRGSLSQPIE